MEYIEKRRFFNGEITSVPLRKERDDDYRIRRNFNKKHLKAYLRGDKLFSFGFNEKHEPIWFKVAEGWRS